MHKLMSQIDAIPDQPTYRRAVLNRDVDTRYLRQGRVGRVLPNYEQKQIDNMGAIPDYEFFLEKNPDMSFLVFASEIDWL